ncbi:MAG: DUF3343 domain-containing protein [Bacteroidales bacterium]
MNKKEKILIFKSIRQVIKAEKFCLSSNLNHRIIPVPRHISSECGMCIIVDEEEMQTLTVYLNNNQIEYRVEEKGHGE